MGFYNKLGLQGIKTAEEDLLKVDPVIGKDLFEVLIWCGASGTVVACDTSLMGFNNDIYPFQSHDRDRMTRCKPRIYLYCK